MTSSPCKFYTIFLFLSFALILFSTLDNIRTLRYKPVFVQGSAQHGISHDHIETPLSVKITASIRNMHILGLVNLMASILLASVTSPANKINTTFSGSTNVISVIKLLIL
ncbi:transmembrane protein, putative [Medicago truncatula]|uniref:Transmembrane protein, putative n=1 Tax=Medicago truncatula TaxID=3880 RepID=A0A072TX97_MEDTR|nr:transmembrane protein, putative [Medicago truncatula]